MNSSIKTNQKYNKDTFKEEINILYPKDLYEKDFEKALAEIKKDAVAAGFRKGNVPENVVLSKYFKEINDKALSISIENALKEVGELNPKPAETLSVEKVSQNEEKDFEFLITYLPFPEIILKKLDDIKLKLKDPKKVSKEDVDSELKNLWFHFASKTNKDLKKDDYKPELIDEKFLEENNLTKVYKDVKNVKDLEKELEKYIQNTYDSNAQLEWESEAQDKIVERAEFDKIEGLIQKEVEGRIENYKNRFKELGVDAEKYLQESNVNLDDLRKDWTPAAEKTLKLELLLQKYAQENNISPDEEEVKEELTRLDAPTKEKYKDNPALLESLVRYYYINQKVFNLLIDKIKENSGIKK